jgi:hypothetical protein
VSYQRLDFHQLELHHHRKAGILMPILQVSKWLRKRKWLSQNLAPPCLCVYFLLLVWGGLLSPGLILQYVLAPFQAGLLQEPLQVPALRDLTSTLETFQLGPSIGVHCDSQPSSNNHCQLTTHHLLGNELSALHTLPSIISTRALGTGMMILFLNIRKSRLK